MRNYSGRFSAHRFALFNSVQIIFFSLPPAKKQTTTGTIPKSVVVRTTQLSEIDLFEWILCVAAYTNRDSRAIKQTPQRSYRAQYMGERETLPTHFSPTCYHSFDWNWKHAVLHARGTHLFTSWVGECVYLPLVLGCRRADQAERWRRCWGLTSIYRKQTTWWDYLCICFWVRWRR